MSYLDLLRENGAFAAVCGIIGVVVAGAVAGLRELSIKKFDDGTSIRKELYAETQRLSAELAKTRQDCIDDREKMDKHLEDWRAKYYSLWQQHAALQAKHDILAHDLQELTEIVQAMKLRDEARNAEPR